MITKLFKIAFFQDHFTLLNVILIRFSKFSKKNKLLNILSKHSRKTFLLVIGDLCEDTHKMEITKDCLESTAVNKSLWGRKKIITFSTDLRF